MLRKIKRSSLELLKSAGVFELNQSGRRQKLLILAYHGISIDDEHQWNPGLYMTADFLRSRLQLIRDLDCTVLPLGEALDSLSANSLPKRSVVLTFDDGNFDFYSRAYPILQEFNYPVTLYATTFYSHYTRPVFDVMCSYLVWKGRDRVLDFSDLTGREVKIDLKNPDALSAAVKELHRFARERKLSAEEKDALAASLAEHLNIDYTEILEKRILQLLRPEEMKELASKGVDIQLHTHRHRVPETRDLFVREIEDNRSSIQQTTNSQPTHFCYPSGRHAPQFLPWLHELQVVSATTCEPGFVSENSNRLLLPRLLDHSAFPAVELEGWLTGVAPYHHLRRLLGKFTKRDVMNAN